MATVVVALGGSLLRPENEQLNTWLEDLVGVIQERSSAGENIVLVVGGGAPARDSINLARPVINNVFHLDKIGIAATRLNATIIREAMSDSGILASGEIPQSIEAALECLENEGVAIMGGTVPGHTTDAVAIRLAIVAKAEKCIIATDVDKVYSEDPRANPDAKSFDSLSLSQLQEIVGPPEHSKAGVSQVVDPVGVDDALRNSLPLDILDGRNVENIRLSLEGKTFNGTTVRV